MAERELDKSACIKAGRDSKKIGPLLSRLKRIVSECEELNLEIIAAHQGDTVLMITDPAISIQKSFGSINLVLGEVSSDILDCGAKDDCEEHDGNSYR